MSELQQFQREAVDLICQQLQRNGSGRFLLADEVGLGKTMVARGVIEELERRNRSGKGSVCIYLCSNLEIADQNQDKLKRNKVRESATRLTLIPLRAAAIHATRAEGKSQLFVFTPDTSLNVTGATGIKAERRMLLACLYAWKPHRIGAQLAVWIEFFRCGAGQRSPKARANWGESCSPAKLRREIADMAGSGLQRRLLAHWNRAFVNIKLGEATVSEKSSPSKHHLLDALCRAVTELANNSGDDANRRRLKRNRNLVIGALRKGVAEAAIDFLASDLVLVDEFQRFREVIDLAENKGELACRLFEGAGKAPKVLILSATPYKAVTFDHEQESHYRDFRRTLSFLLGSRQGKQDWLNDVDTLLLSFRNKVTAETLELPALQQLKADLENRLSEVMCRTERNRFVVDENKGVEDCPDFSLGKRLQSPDPQALAEFVSLRSLLQRHAEDDRPFPSIIDFWKSCSSVLSFMDAGYVLIKRLRSQKAQINARLLRKEVDLTGPEHRNLKVQTLMSRIRESSGSSDAELRRWRFLWTRPTYCYHQDEFFEEADPTKFLVFSRWRFVPKAISFIVSNEFEPVPSGFRKSRRQPLELNSECLKVCAPLIALADIVNTAAWSASVRKAQGGTAPRAAQLRRHVRRELRRVLKEAGITIERKIPRKSYWPALFALERQHISMLPGASKNAAKPERPDWSDVLASAVATEGSLEDTAEQAKEFLRTTHHWAMSDSKAVGEQTIAFPEELLEDAVTMAISSPAISLMRASRLLFGDDAVYGLETISRTCFQQLRSFFNKGYAQAAVRRHARSGRYPVYVGRVAHKGHIYEGRQAAIVEQGQWEQAQALLSEKSASRQRRPIAPGGRPLAGRLFDDRGNAMSPSYAIKRNGQRYHYYVSQARLQNDKARAGTVARVPAKEIERLVQEAVSSSDNGDSGAASEQLRQRVERVVVHADRIAIVQAVTDDRAGDEEEESRTIVVPAKLAHRNRAVVFDDGRTGPDPVLLKALGRAHEWRTWLEQGEALSYRELASKAGVTPGYVQKVLPLAFLAPGLTRELLDGQRRLHGGLMARLNRGIPADWDQQLTSF